MIAAQLDEDSEQRVRERRPWLRAKVGAIGCMPRVRLSGAGWDASKADGAGFTSGAGSCAIASATFVRTSRLADRSSTVPSKPQPALSGIHRGAGRLGVPGHETPLTSKLTAFSRKDAIISTLAKLSKRALATSSDDRVSASSRIALLARFSSTAPQQAWKARGAATREGADDSVLGSGKWQPVPLRPTCIWPNGWDLTPAVLTVRTRRP